MKNPFPMISACRRKPHLVIWLSALSCKMSRGCLHNKIRWLFEWEVSNDMHYISVGVL
ncbi:hypothetical protein MTR_6g071905 [Medicago truncatula]|uniref:Uncharacterized protein n=1 Tax=Medicago truncatula TaxID=3880 RepID=A0A072UAE4_MEDTR|nr:hypothetical protein MTR_6g071905 [Medicago truncatula]